MRIGIDLGGTKIEAITLEEDGRIHARQRVAAPQGDYQKTVQTIAGLVRDIEKDVGGSARGVTTPVGVGIPGAISPATGLIKNANSTWLIGHPLDQDLAAALDRPVKLANDANCFALSEAVDGAGQGAAVVFGVILGTGVGGGVVVNGNILSGPNAITGEWGHNPLPWRSADEYPGVECYCGKQGCIETFLCGSSLARILDNGLNAEEITAQANAGDPAATQAIDQYANRLARALASVINILDPNVIVLGGGLSNIGYLYEAVPDLWQQWVFSDQADTKLVPNQHGDSSGVRGAAWLWYDDNTEQK